MTQKLDMADVEEKAMEKAEEMAQKQYGVSFDDLTPQQQMRVWNEAEQDVINELALRAEVVCESYWDELELEKRLGN